MQRKNLKTEKLENYRKMIVKWKEFKEHAPGYFKKYSGQELDGKTLEEWEEESNKQLEILNKRINNIETLETVKKIAPVVLVFLALAVIFVPFKHITGFVTGGLFTNTSSYTDQLNVYYSSPNTYYWMPVHRGPISSVSATGEIVGEGSAKVYLVDGNKTYKLIDSGSLGKEASNFFQKMFRKKYDTSSDKGVTTRLEYNPGTLYDKDDNGIETQGSVIDFTVANSIFNVDKKSGGLCTRWQIENLDTEKTLFECYGNSKCCISLNLTSMGLKWNETYYVNRLKGITGDSNKVMAQVYYDEKISGKSVIPSNKWAELPAVFANETTIHFTNECKQTCNINLNSSKGTYLLKFEIDNVKIRINNLTYSGPQK